MIPPDTFNVPPWKSVKDFDIVIPRIAISDLQISKDSYYDQERLRITISGPYTESVYRQLQGQPVMEPQLEPDADSPESKVLELRRKLNDAQETIATLNEEIEDQLGEIGALTSENRTLNTTNKILNALVDNYNSHPSSSLLASGGYTSPTPVPPITPRPLLTPRDIGDPPSLDVEGAISWT